MLPLFEIRPRAWNPPLIETLRLDVDAIYDWGRASYGARCVIWDRHGKLIVVAVFPILGAMSVRHAELVVLRLGF